MSFYHDTKENIDYLSSISKIPPLVVKAWFLCEGQEVDNPTNPLNIRRYPNNPMQISSKGGYGIYNTVEDGLRDVVRTLSLNYYNLLNRAINGGDPANIARHIELSPWAAGHYGAKFDPHVSGCISKTYARLLKESKPKSDKQLELDAIEKRANEAGHYPTKQQILATYNRNLARAKTNG